MCQEQQLAIMTHERPVQNNLCLLIDGDGAVATEAIKYQPGLTSG